MKSEHRHELKTNELAEWMANFPQWLRENAKMIIYVCVLIIVVTGLYVWKWYNKNVISTKQQADFTNLITQLSGNKMRILQDQAKGFDSSYNLLNIAGNFQVAAQNTENEQMAALALVKHAESLRTELHYRLESASEQEKKTQIDKAYAGYEQALAKACGSRTIMAAAKFGIGLCEEERGKFAAAEQIYRDIADSNSFEGTVAAASAKLRLEMMAGYQEKIVFKRAPKPIPVQNAGPQLQMAVPDGNTSDRQ